MSIYLIIVIIEMKMERMNVSKKGLKLLAAIAMLTNAIKMCEYLFGFHSRRHNTGAFD